MRAALVTWAAALAAAAPAHAAVVLDDGHVDYAARIVSGALQSQIKDSTGGEVAWREPGEVVFHVRPEARTTLPADGRLGFLGPPGSDAWIIPQVQKEGILWAGWNTEELAAADVEGRVAWRLARVDGPGAFALFQTDGFGRFDVLFATRDGLPDERSIPLGTHAHGNWGFTAEGVYRLTFEMHAARPGGGAWSDRETLAVAVGNVDPAAVAPGPLPEGGQPPVRPLPAAPGARDPDGQRPPRRLSLKLGRARVVGRTLRLRLRLGARSRVKAAILRSGRTIARTPPRTLGAGGRTLVARLGRAPAAGRYRLRVRAAARGRTAAAGRRIRVFRAARKTAGASAAGQVVLEDGHVDYGVRLIKGRLRAQVKDTTKGAKEVRWREPSDVVWRIGDKARYRIPEGAPRVLGKPGRTVWMIPQVQKAGILWAGWNTEELSRRRIAGAVRWTLQRVNGPGELILFQTGSFGDIIPIFDSRDGLPDTLRVPLGTHAHGNWAFTRAGEYRLTFQMRARLRGGGTLGDTDTLVVRVGNAATSSEPAASDQAVAAGAGAEAGGEAGSASGGGGGGGALAATGLPLAPQVVAGAVLMLGGWRLSRGVGR